MIHSAHREGSFRVVANVSNGCFFSSFAVSLLSGEEEGGCAMYSSLKLLRRWGALKLAEYHWSNVGVQGVGGVCRYRSRMCLRQVVGILGCVSLTASASASSGFPLHFYFHSLLIFVLLLHIRVFPFG
eukprot:g63179.t1